MRVLVTGITGQVGGTLVAMTPPPGAEWVPAGRDRLDLSRPSAVASAMDALHPDAVINCAAYTNVDGAEDEPDLADRVNHLGPAALATECARRSLPLLHLSTDFVFGPRSGTGPYAPDAVVDPVSVYGATKAAGERAVLGAGGGALVVRTAWVYAARGQNFVRTMLRVGAARDTLDVVADQRGCPTAAEDIAAALHRLVARLAVGRPLPGGIWHLSGGGETTWHGLAEAVFDLVEPSWGRRPHVRPITTAEWPAKAVRPADSRLDCASTVRTLGVSCRPWREALAEVVARLTADEAGVGAPGKEGAS